LTRRESALGARAMRRDPLPDQISGREDGAFMEPSGRSQWQSVAMQRGRKRLRQAKTVATACDRLPRNAMVRRGRRFESVRGLQISSCSGRPPLPLWATAGGEDVHAAGTWPREPTRCSATATHKTTQTSGATSNAHGPPVESEHHPTSSPSGRPSNRSLTASIWPARGAVGGSSARSARRQRTVLSISRTAAKPRSTFATTRMSFMPTLNESSAPAGCSPAKT
jgi:hypothetical protein